MQVEIQEASGLVQVGETGQVAMSALPTQVLLEASPEALVRAIDANKRLNQKTQASALAEVKRAAAWHVPEDRPQVSLWADLDGAHVIVDMRSDNLSSRDALGVVMTLLGSLSQRRGPDKDFLPAVAVLDEFNKIVAHSDLSTVALSQLTEVRHRKTWTFASGQLPDQFPEEISELSSGSICGQTEGAGSYEALCRMKPALRKISRETFAKLKKGEVVVCFRDANDERQAVADAEHGDCTSKRRRCAERRPVVVVRAGSGTRHERLLVRRHRTVSARMGGCPLTRAVASASRRLSGSAPPVGRQPSACCSRSRSLQRIVAPGVPFYYDL